MGARAVQQAILSGFPDADLAVSLVWVHMLPLDSPLAARLVARTMRDSRARHFYDPNNGIGQAVAQSLGHPGKVAWDIYLFYGTEVRWEDGLPIPACWAHQLSSESWIDPTRYHHRDLAQELAKAMRQMGLVEGGTRVEGSEK